MKHRGPLLTLIAGLIIAAALTVASMKATSDNTATQDAASASDSRPAKPSQSTSASGTIPPQASASPTAPVTGRRAVFAGTVGDGNVTVAISVHDDQAVAYVCDGNRLEAWLTGSARGGALKLTGPDGANLTGTYGRVKAAGAVKADGKSWQFDAPTVNKPSGLYRSTGYIRNVRFVGTWVVLPSGRQIGVATLDGAPEPAPEFDVDAGTVTVQGQTVKVTPAEAGE